MLDQIAHARELLFTAQALVGLNAGVLNAVRDQTLAVGKPLLTKGALERLLLGVLKRGGREFS